MKDIDVKKARPKSGKQYWRLSLASYLLALAFSGCGTINTVRHSDRQCLMMDAEFGKIKPRYIYSGIRCDAESLLTSSFYYGVGVIPVLIDMPLSVVADTVILPMQIVRRSAYRDQERVRQRGPFVFRIAWTFEREGIENLGKRKEVADPDFTLPSSAPSKAPAERVVEWYGQFFTGAPQMGEEFNCSDNVHDRELFLVQADIASLDPDGQVTWVLATRNENFRKASAIHKGAILHCTWYGRKTP